MFTWDFSAQVPNVPVCIRFGPLLDTERSAELLRLYGQYFFWGSVVIASPPPLEFTHPELKPANPNLNKISLT